MKKLVIVAGVLALASAASADLICEVVQNASPGAGLESYTVYFKGTTPGEYLSAVDISFNGPLYQGWWYGKAWNPTPWIGCFFTGESASWDKDSHLLLGEPPHAASPPGDPQTYGVLVAVGAVEDLDTGNVTSPPDANGYQFGLGTYLANASDSNMAFAIGSAWQTENVAFAQIVLESGTEALLTGKAVANNGSYIDLDVIIPEPAALALLAMGAAGIVMKRKKRTA